MGCRRKNRISRSGCGSARPSPRAHFDAYADFGANLFVGVENPEGANEALIRQAGMRTLIQADERTRFNNIGSENAGWLTSDEVDMTHGPGGGPRAHRRHPGGAAAGRQDSLRQLRPGRVVLGDRDRGRSVRQPVPADRLHRPLLVHLPQPDGDLAVLAAGRLRATLSGPTLRRAANYGYQIDYLRHLDSLDGKRQPVWAVVELGWPFSESASQGGRRIQPAELRAAVWQSIIAGARGIIYFDHNFGPGTARLDSPRAGIR